MYRGSGQRWRKAAAAGAAGTTLAALGVIAGSASIASAASSDACWATAVNINSCGGMSALVAAAKAEGTINLTADPTTWANYGNIMKDFGAKYRLKVNDFNPDGSSAEELSEINLDKGKSDEPDVVDIGFTWLAGAAQRTFVNTEAKLLMMTHAFEVWQVHRVALQTDVRNKRSWAAIERIGGQLDGIMRAARPGSDDTVRTSARFSIVAAEWPHVKARLTARLA